MMQGCKRVMKLQKPTIQASALSQKGATSSLAINDQVVTKFDDVWAISSAQPALKIR